MNVSEGMLENAVAERVMLMKNYNSSVVVVVFVVVG